MRVRDLVAGRRFSREGWAALVFLLTLPVMAGASAPTIGGADPAGPMASSPAGGGDPMNLDVQGADIRTVLRSIAEFGKVNIVPDRDVEGATNVRLSEVPWREALDIVCESAGLEAVNRDDGVIRVATRKVILDEEIDRHSAERKREELLPLKTAVFQVNYANATELKTSVGFILTQRGSAEVDTRTNSILVTDIPDRVAQVGDMIHDLDTETLQVEIVAKLVDVDVTFAREFGISWDLANLHSTPQRISGSASFDGPVADANTNLKFGVIRHWGNIDATIQAMEKENKANIISNPSITTVNNRKARILVGKEVPLIVLDKAGNPITELKKVGITLEVTPYINSENRVTMDLHPEVSDLSSQATVQGGIVFSTSEADTRVMVNDGETAVIGGLMSTNDTNFETGIPILRSIPIIGALFRESEVRKDHRELLIFVTPRIVRGLASK
jgi:type IV pilus assembly protein PilQ